MHEELKKAAEAATPGPWEFYHSETRTHIAGGEIVDAEPLPYGVVITGYDMMFNEDDDGNSEPMELGEKIRTRDGEFIAVANPAAVLALIAVNEKLLEALKHVKKIQDENYGDGMLTHIRLHGITPLVRDAIALADAKP